MTTGKMAFLLANPTVSEFEIMPITCLRWRPAGNHKTQNVLVTTSADGTVQHWHVTSGRCLHTIDAVEDNHLYTLDYNPMGTQFCTAGKDMKIRVYDENTKTMIQELGHGNDIPGHSNRIFALKYDKMNPNVMISGGWDNTIVVYDVRRPYPAFSMLGPHVCGESLDINGTTILAGSYSQDENLTLWDMKMQKKLEVIDWFQDFEKEENPNATLLYGAVYSKNHANYIVAGGTSKNEVRVFQNPIGTPGHKCVASITDMSKACMSLDYGNVNDIFAIGCADGYLRIMGLDTISHDEHDSEPKPE